MQSKIIDSSWGFFMFTFVFLMWDFTLHVSGNWALIDFQITDGAPFYLTFLVCFCHKFRINRFNLPSQPRPPAGGPPSINYTFSMSKCRCKEGASAA